MIVNGGMAVKDTLCCIKLSWTHAPGRMPDPTVRVQFVKEVLHITDSAELLHPEVGK